MNIQNILEAIKSESSGMTIEYYKITIPASSAAADEQPPGVLEEYKCESCGRPFKPFTWRGQDYSAETAFSWSLKKNGRAICLGCVKKQETA